MNYRKFSLLVFLSISASWPAISPVPVEADEIRRVVTLPYVCSRDGGGRVLVSRVADSRTYEVVNWSESVTGNICNPGYYPACTPVELHSFSFRCGSAGLVHSTDLYLASPNGTRWRARKQGAQVLINLNNNLVHAFPVGRSPLASDAKLGTKVIGADCGGGLFCDVGSKCSRGGGCVPVNSVDCGSGRSCPLTNQCSMGGGCVPANTVDCGSGRYCPLGTTCGPNSCQRAVALPVEPAPPSPQVQAPNNNVFGKDIPQGYAWAWVAFCLMAAAKELIKSGTPPPYKFVTAGVLAGIEGIVYLMTGYSTGDPKIMDVLAMSAPPAGVYLGAGFLPKVA